VITVAFTDVAWRKRALILAKECDELPCSKLIQFCYSPVWLHHMPAIENLKRQKAIGTEKWHNELA